MPTINLRPEKVQINSIQGADITLPIRVVQDDGTTPVNISAFTFSMDVVTGSGAIIEALTEGSGITIVSAVGGTLQINIEGDNLIFSGNCDSKLYGTLWVIASGTTTQTHTACQQPHFAVKAGAIQKAVFRGSGILDAKKQY